jgi:hypothetical protein
MFIEGINMSSLSQISDWMKRTKHAIEFSLGNIDIMKHRERVEQLKSNLHVSNIRKVKA